MSNQNNQILKNTNAQILDEFNASIMFDKELYSQDIKGSIAHSQMLCEQGILTVEEQKAIEFGLLQVKNEIESGEFKFSLAYEDIHMAVETRLTEIVGEPGKRLHTARSRNDQVATDFRLYVQDKSLSIKEQLKELVETFVTVAGKYTTTLIPGMTHLQHAQPLNFGYHLLAYANMFKRDFERFESSYERNNYCPLGSAALAGTPHNINRESTSQKLGFISPTLHAMDTVSDRDFALEILFNISTCMMHISRISEELILWSSYEFQFVRMSDEYATTSSIMPQKKNPDVPELLRGKTGRVYGNLISLLTVMKGLPLAYNKDTQEDKDVVTKANELNKDISELTIEEIRSANDELKDVSEEIVMYLDLRNSMNARNSFGGTSSMQTENQIKYFEEWLNNK